MMILLPIIVKSGSLLDSATKTITFSTAAAVLHLFAPGRIGEGGAQKHISMRHSFPFNHLQKRDKELSSYPRQMTGS